MSASPFPVFTRINKFLSAHLYLIAFGGILLGLVFPDLTTLKPAVPYLFGYMTLVTALGISLSDMGRVLRTPVPLFLIFFLLHVLLPFLVFLLTGVVLAADPLFRVGLVLATIIPVGVVSVIWTGVVGGALPFALTNVAVGSLLSPFVVPFSVSILFGTTIEFDTLGMMKGLALMIVVPTIIGITLHEVSQGRFGKRRADVNGTFSKFALLLVIAVNVAAANSVVSELSLALIPVLILLPVQTIGGYLLGYGTGKLFRFPEPLRKSFIFGCGMRNTSAGIVVALQYFPPETAVPVVLAMLFQQPLAAIVARLLSRKKPEPAALDTGEIELLP